MNIGNCYIEEINNQIKMIKQVISRLEKIENVSVDEQEKISQIILRLNIELNKRYACIIYN